MSKPVRVGLLGCGTVGSALAELIGAESATIQSRTGVRLELAAIAVRNIALSRQASVPTHLLTADASAVVTDPAVDVVVELIGGLEPAGALVAKALEAGKPVVTANKELLADRGAELAELAASAGLDLLYEAAVAGAIPVVRPLRESLAGERIQRVMGIVNGTTNYILTQMSDHGETYPQALHEAQALGYAEANPSADVEGYDAAAKIAILAGLAFGGAVGVGDVHREGISGLDVGDLAAARRLGYEVKLLAVAERVEPGGRTTEVSGSWSEGEADQIPMIAVRVHPAMVPRSHPLASVRGPFNAVFIEGEAVGELMLYGRGAGGRPTAAAVLGDLIDAAQNLRAGGGGRALTQPPARVRPMSELRCSYYLSVEVVDRPGVLAAVAGVLGAHEVSVRSMEQLGLGDEARLVFITHLAREADVQAALAGLRDLAAVERIGGLLRLVEAGER
ncbi:MAG: homoserine dehydrogenase [Acidimicrobiales bacterium]